MTFIPTRLNWRLLPIHIGILATFALTPLWYRFDNAPGAFEVGYSTGFLVCWPMLWTIFWWLILGLPGFKDLLGDKLRRWWGLIWVSLALWALLSWVWAYTRPFRPDVALGAGLQFSISVLFVFVIACARPSLRQIIAILTLTLGWNAVLAVAQAGLQHSVGLKFLGEYDLIPSKSGAVIVQIGSYRWVRPYGLMPHPNMLAGILVVGLFAALALALSKRALRWPLGVAVFLVGLWALLLTFSRAAWLGFAAGAFALLPLIGSRLRKSHAGLQFVLTMTTAIMVAGIFFLIYRPFFSARAGLDESVEQRSVSDRAVYNDFAYQAISEFPILGVGIGNFPWRASYYLMFTDYDLRGQPVHHVLLSAWAELGIVGLALTIIVMVLGVEMTLHALKPPQAQSIVTEPAGEFADSGAATARETSAEDDLLRAVLLAGFIALGIIGLLDHYPWTLIQFQALWWGLLAAAGKPGD